MNIRKFFVAAVVTMLGTIPGFAIDIDTVTSFNGSSQPSSKFYIDIPGKYDLVTGMTAAVPGTKTKQLDVDLLLGIKTTLPLLDTVDAYFIFDDHNGVVRSGRYEKSDFYTHSLNISKSWLYSLTEEISLGVTADLVQFMLEGSKEIRILTGMNPSLGCTIRLF